MNEDRNGVNRNKFSGKSGGQEDKQYDFYKKILMALSNELRGNKIDLSTYPKEKTRQMLESYLERIVTNELTSNYQTMNRGERKTIIDQCIDDTLGNGPIESLLRDESITEIMINGPFDVRVEQNGLQKKTPIKFYNEQHLMNYIERVVSRSGRHIDEADPMVDARLENGSRVHIVIPPVSLNGPHVTIRKFTKAILHPEKLIENGSVTHPVMRFLEACVQSQLNIIVSGGTNSGKTTLLNVLSAFIQPEQRIITIEDSAELQLQQEHVVKLECRHASIEGKNEITTRDLVRTSLRMNPNRIIVGECRGGEALDMLQAMNTGHDGSMTTIHANSPQDVISRLETLVLMAGYDLPTRAIRDQIASAVHLIVHTAHFIDGKRRIQNVSEIRRTGTANIEVVDIFTFDQTGYSANNTIHGKLIANNITPRFLSSLHKAGFTFPQNFFEKA